VLGTQSGMQLALTTKIMKASWSRDVVRTWSVKLFHSCVLHCACALPYVGDSSSSYALRFAVLLPSPPGWSSVCKVVSASRLQDSGSRDEVSSVLTLHSPSWIKLKTEYQGLKMR
jgi:hypothetical protein